MQAFLFEKGKLVPEMGAHEKRKISLENIASATGWVADVINIFTSLPSLPSIIALVSKNALIAKVAIIICIVIFCFSFGCQVFIKWVEGSNNKKIAQEEDCGEKRQREYISKNLLLYRRKKRVSILMIFCIVFGVLNGYSLKFNEKSDNVEGSETGSSGEEVNVDTLSPEEEEKVTYELILNTSFILNEDEIPRLENPLDINRVFYVSGQDVKYAVEIHINEIKNIQKASGTGKLTEIEKGLIDKASAAERDFKKKVKDAKTYKEKRQIEEWLETVPSASDYEEDVIVNRITMIDDGKADGDICFLVANDFQYIGDEYKAQDEDYRAVIYYWVQSIIYTEEAMSYANISEEDWATYYGYLRARYRDIADYIEKNWDKIEDGDKEMYGQWRDAARKIYEAM